MIWSSRADLGVRTDEIIFDQSKIKSLNLHRYVELNCREETNLSIDATGKKGPHH
jgi:hypothetical protein